MDYILASDMLERQFGPCTIDVLWHDGLSRFAAVKAPNGDILELAKTAFNPKGIQEFHEAHQVVMAGNAIGKTFKALGIAFTRDPIATERRVLSDVFSPYFSIHEDATVLIVNILVGTRQTPYARILEVYSPRVSMPASPIVSPQGNKQSNLPKLLHELEKFLESTESLTRPSPFPNTEAK